jgi:hypothetical protein
MTQLDCDIALFSDRSITPENPILIHVGPETALAIREKGWQAVGVDLLG